MKTKKIIATLMLLGCNVAFGSNNIPANYSMDCWDGTFAYNRLKVQVDGDQLKFNSSGQGLGVYQNLVKLPANGSWGQLDVSFSTFLKSCKLSSTDSKILTCVSDLLIIKAKGTAGINSKIDEKIEIKNAVVQIRKVDELAIWGNNTSGYELVIAENHIRSSPTLAQRYFYGLDENETDGCTLRDFQ